MSYIEPKIKPTDCPKTVIKNLADGSKAAETVLLGVMAIGSQIDPDNRIGGARGAFHMLDSLAIYGDRIARLYTEVCKADMVIFLAMLRAVDMRIFSHEKLVASIEAGMDSPDTVDNVTNEVKALIPTFSRTSAPKNIAAGLQDLVSSLLLSSFLSSILFKAAASSIKDADPQPPGDTTDIDIEKIINDALAGALPGFTSKATIIHVAGGTGRPSTSDLAEIIAKAKSKAESTQ